MLTMGIDYGTTKNAVVITDSDDPEIFFSASAAHNAALHTEAYAAEQDFELVWQSICQLISSMPPHILKQVQAIGLTGQMHSVVCWNDHHVSPVITWQDKRASATGRLEYFLQNSSRHLADGFGAVSLAVMAENGTLSEYSHASSPISLIAARLTGNQNYSFIDPTFGASWGIWNMEHASWNFDDAAKLGIPAEILPHVVPSASIIGYTSNIPSLPDGIPVLAPIGDNQASVLATSGNAGEELYLTLGTGAQLSAIITTDELDSIPGNVELRPFINNHFLVVNAPLCGGKAWAALGDFINNSLSSLGLPPFQAKDLLNKLDALALSAQDTPLNFSPIFLGTRNNPNIRASISGISLNNFTLPNIAAALADGIVAELFAPFPKEFIRSRKKIIGSGNCVRYCVSIRNAIHHQSQLPLHLITLKEEAACGASRLYFFSREKK